MAVRLSLWAFLWDSCLHPPLSHHTVHHQGSLERPANIIRIHYGQLHDTDVLLDSHLYHTWVQIDLFHTKRQTGFRGRKMCRRWKKCLQRQEKQKLLWSGGDEGIPLRQNRNLCVNPPDVLAVEGISFACSVLSTEWNSFFPTVPTELYLQKLKIHMECSTQAIQALLPKALDAQNNPLNLVPLLLLSDSTETSTIRCLFLFRCCHLRNYYTSEQPVSLETSTWGCSGNGLAVKFQDSQETVS